MRDIEHRIQQAYFTWAMYARVEYPDLELLYAIPNGGARNVQTGARLKAEGVRRGVPDMHLPVARGEFIGLWLEFKTETNYADAEQKKRMERLRAAGHRCEIVRSADDARRITEEYLTVHNLKRNANVF